MTSLLVGIHQSVMTLRPLTAEVTNIDHFSVMQRLAEPAGVLASVWMLF